jgi:hypothetical protein
VRRAIEADLPGVVARLAVTLLGVLALGALTPGLARANGAFPDSQGILTPTDRPGETVLVTNFGLVISEDGGHSWGWSCEQPGNSLGILYQLGPAPRHRLFALANDALVFSDDGTCGWQFAGGLLAGQQVTDAFADPTNADRVLAIGLLDKVYTVFESLDGGATFARAIYTAAAGDGINGVEVSRSNPQTVYIAIAKGFSVPTLARSSDGGAHWTLDDLSAKLGTGTLRIISVDPADANRVLLRMSGPSNETLALTADGGATVTTPLTVDGVLTAFARLPSGTLLAGANLPPNGTAALYRSRDAGATFTPVANIPSIRGLSVRGNAVYAATDNFGNGYALGTSSDEGDTWTAVMSYGEIAGIISCLKSACQTTCEAEVALGLWSDATCSADLPGSTPDGGAGAGGRGGADAAATGGDDGGRGGAGVSGDAGGHGAAPSSGGGCRTAGGPRPVEVGGTALLAAAAFLAARRSRSARRRPQRRG